MLVLITSSLILKVGKGVKCLIVSFLSYVIEVCCNALTVEHAHQHLYIGLIFRAIWPGVVTKALFDPLGSTSACDELAKELQYGKRGGCIAQIYESQETLVDARLTRPLLQFTGERRRHTTITMCDASLREMLKCGHSCTTPRTARKAGPLAAPVPLPERGTILIAFQLQGQIYQLQTRKSARYSPSKIVERIGTVVGNSPS